MIQSLNKIRFFSKLLLDASLAAAAIELAYYVRLGDQTAAFAGNLPQQAALLCFFISLPVLRFTHLNRSLWRYTSMADLIQIAKAATLQLALFYLFLFVTSRLSGVPRSLPVIHWLLQVALWGAPRALYRLWHHRQRYVRLATGGLGKVPVLLLGTGARAELFIRESAERPSTPYRVVGILDLNPALEGQALHGIPIYTELAKLKHIVAALAQSQVRPQKIVIADDAVEGKALEQLLAQAETLGLSLARLPRQTELKHSAHEAFAVRPIAIEDLLGRTQHVHDREAMRRFVEGKCVLITGAGGTIGSELARQIVSLAPAKLVLFELSEYHLYQIHRELKDSSVPIVALLCDVRDSKALEFAFATHRPEIVFHAAAIKHVPLAQENAEEAILTNVVGTSLLAQACKTHGAKTMVLISTDKAVNPTSVMGATKRLAEKICRMAQGNGTARFVIVRFGNVLGSAGSVVPLFQEQLARGGPLTVTDAAMERYFMTVREAVELVIQAAAMGQASGGTYVLDMGTPLKIVTLAEQMIRLAGLKPYQDIDITFTGLRDGEKLAEELFYTSENPVYTKHAGIRQAQPLQDTPEQDALAQLEGAARNRHRQDALERLHALVPEYKE